MDGVTTGLDLRAGRRQHRGLVRPERRVSGRSTTASAWAHEMVRMIVHDGMDLYAARGRHEMLRAACRVAGPRTASKAGRSRSAISIRSTGSPRSSTRTCARARSASATTAGLRRTGISTYELFEVQRAAARYDRPIGSHTRFHGGEQTAHRGAAGVRRDLHQRGAAGRRRCSTRTTTTTAGGRSRRSSRWLARWG